MAEVPNKRNVYDEWRAARLFMTKGPSATLEFLKEEPKVWLQAYQSQAMHGRCEEADTPRGIVDTLALKKLEAWRHLGDMSSEEAKRRFVALLTSVLPSWKEWYESYNAKQLNEKIHGDLFANLNVENHENESDRLLKLFQTKTGISVSKKPISRL